MEVLVKVLEVMNLVVVVLLLEAGRQNCGERRRE